MTLHIRNWNRWQSYRKGRGQPPWIKLHRRVMRNPDWVELSDAQRGQLVAMWLLAADRAGEIPEDPAVIRKLCYLDNEPDLNAFIEKGWIERGADSKSKRRQGDASLSPGRRQHVAPE